MEIKEQTVKQLNEFLMKVYRFTSKEHRGIIDKFFAEQQNAKAHHKTLEETFDDRRVWTKGNEILRIDFPDNQTQGTMELFGKTYNVYLGEVTENNLYSEHTTEYGNKVKERYGTKKFEIIQRDDDYEEKMTDTKTAWKCQF